MKNIEILPSSPYEELREQGKLSDQQEDLLTEWKLARSEVKKKAQDLRREMIIAA